MQELSNEQLLTVIGGTISGSLINAFARGIQAIMDVGRSLGNAIRRITGNSICKL